MNTTANEVLGLHSSPHAQEGQHVVVTSREIGRHNVLVGKVIRRGSQLWVGDVLLWDDSVGPSMTARVIARAPDDADLKP